LVQRELPPQELRAQQVKQAHLEFLELLEYSELLVHLVPLVFQAVARILSRVRTTTGTSAPRCLALAQRLSPDRQEYESGLNTDELDLELQDQKQLAYLQCHLPSPLQTH
jgi:hypothetical protein